MKRNYLKSYIQYFTKFLLASILVSLLSGVALAQYAIKHYIAPAPWQFASRANQLVITTEAGDSGVSASALVSVKKSDGALITTLTVSSGEPTLYRFENLPLTADMMRNLPNTKYADRGLIIESNRPVSVNIRNIMSDEVPDEFLDTEDSYIKGNSSFLSFGAEARGSSFRLGYYRDNWEGLNPQFDEDERDRPVFSVMAINNNTNVQLNGSPLITLNAGESYLFFAEMGALLTSDKSVVANAGAWRDAPGGCGDGVVTPVAPNRVLGSNHIVVRGKGYATSTDTISSEQTTIVASEAGTSITVINYNENGVQIGSMTSVLANAGDHYTFFHGDGQNPYSSSLIASSRPVIVYAGTAQGCEVDMSTVAPVGGCVGSKYLQTSKYMAYGGSDLSYFGYILLQSATNVVYLNDVDIESLEGVEARIPIGNTGNYLLRFENWQIGIPETLTLRSDSRMTVNIVQQGAGSSMSSFISSFNESISPSQVDSVGDCVATLIALDEGLEPYQWYFNGIIIPGATERTYLATEKGNYAVSGTRECGVTQVSEDLYVNVCNHADLAIIKTSSLSEIRAGVEFEFDIKVVNNGPEAATDVLVVDSLPSGLGFVSATAEGAYTPSEHTVKWRIPTLDNGDSTSFTVRVLADESGDFMNIAEVIIADLIDPNPGDNLDSVSFKIYKVEIEAVDDIVDEPVNGRTGLENVINVLTNDTFNTQVPDVAMVALTRLDDPTGSPLVLAEDGSVSVLPNTASGTYTLQYSICDRETLNEDGIGTYCDDATVTINVVFVTQPEAIDDAAETTKGQAVYIPVLVNDIPDNSPLDPNTIEIIDSPRNGMTLPQPDGTIRYMPNPGFIGEDTFTYQVKDENGNVTNVATVTVTVKENPLHIPNVFTPNGDGYNDYFVITGTERYDRVELLVVNRWGNEVYKNSDYKNNWEGNGLNEGTYFYRIHLYAGPNREEYKGPVLIKR